MLALILALVGAPDTTIVEVRLVGVGSVEVEAVLLADATLLLPAADVAALLGEGRPTSAWTSLAELQRRWPPITVTWLPRELLVLIEDPLLVLPASRALRDRTLRSAQRASPLAQLRSGPFATAVVDALGRAAWQAGYNWRGVASFTAQRSSRTGGAWAATLSPVPRVSASYAQGARQPPTIGGHAELGPLWFAPTWTRGQPFQIDGLLTLGRVKLFATSRSAFVLSLQGRGADLQLGRSAGVWASRVSIGPAPANPFSPVVVP